MVINKELEERLKEFPEELQLLAEDILMDISSKKSKTSLEEMILDELNHIIGEGK